MRRSTSNSHRAVPDHPRLTRRSFVPSGYQLATNSLLAASEARSHFRALQESRRRWPPPGERPDVCVWRFGLRWPRQLPSLHQRTGPGRCARHLDIDRAGLGAIDGRCHHARCPSDPRFDRRPRQRRRPRLGHGSPRVASCDLRPHQPDRGAEYHSDRPDRSGPTDLPGRRPRHHLGPGDRSGGVSLRMPSACRWHQGMPWVPPTT